MRFSAILDFSIPRAGSVFGSCVFRQLDVFRLFGAKTTPADTTKPITQRHGIIQRLLRRANSREVTSCIGQDSSIFSTNTNPVTNIRLSAAAMAKGMDRPRHQLFRRRSSAPVTPKTMGRRKTYLSTEGLSRMLSRDSLIRRDFESYAAEQYALENVSFMEALFDWKTKHGTSYQEALRLCELYIFDGSMMQINISYDARVGIEREMADAEEDNLAFVSPQLFDRAAAEITTMMQGGLWGSFVSRGGCDRAESLAAEAMERRSQSREYSRVRSTTGGLALEMV